MIRIYHRYELCEDWRAGFYWNESGKTKAELKELVVSFFCDSKKVRKYMNQVVKDWPFSTQHNLTNESMNRVAWLGQAAACIYCKCPSQITMESWRDIPESHRNEADRIAHEIIETYEKKSVQLCLNLF